MPLVQVKCTSCGGVLEVDKNLEAAICKHCGSAFIVEKAINNFNTINNISNSNVTFYGNVEDDNSKMNKLIKNANEFVNLGNTSKAIKIYEELFEEFPGNSEVFKECIKLIDLMSEKGKKKLAIDFCEKINNLFPKKYEFWEKRLDLMYSIILERNEFSIEDREDYYNHRLNITCADVLAWVQYQTESNCPMELKSSLKERENNFYNRVIKGVKEGSFHIVNMIYSINRFNGCSFDVEGVGKKSFSSPLELINSLHTDLGLLVMESNNISKKLKQMGITLRFDDKNKRTTSYWPIYKKKDETSFISSSVCILGFEGLIFWKYSIYDESNEIACVVSLDFEAKDSEEFYQRAFDSALSKIDKDTICPFCGKPFKLIEEKKLFKKGSSYRICEGCKIRLENDTAFRIQ